LLDPDDQLFPDGRHIERHAIAFAQMMFAHAAFEREVRDLQGSIIDDPTFGERPTPMGWPKPPKAHGGADPIASWR
jgi:hypothetical protein